MVSFRVRVRVRARVRVRVRVRVTVSIQPTHLPEKSGFSPACSSRIE